MNECVLFDRGRSGSGYGVVWVDGKPIFAHRKVMADLHGEDAIAGKNVNHHCDVKMCVNPDHLYIGTSSENQEDSYRRQRRPTKLTAEEVREIRAAGEATQRELAARYGVRQSTIRQILLRRTWRYVK